MTQKITEDNLSFLMGDMVRLMRKRFAVRAKNVNLTSAQWRVLSYVLRRPGMTQAALADILDIEPISLTRLLDRMETAGLVRREIDPNDRRARNIYMTDKAEPLMAQLRAINAEFHDEAFMDISPEDLDAAKAVILAIRANLTKMGAADDG